ncbi:MAG: trypsin-like peptidase domain-containing protein [Planctomycetes bacterium]|nr:trypsin-like peptidase domain-containing protein [Planctomycetota bacterium]
MRPSRSELRTWALVGPLCAACGLAAGWVLRSDAAPVGASTSVGGSPLAVESRPRVEAPRVVGIPSLAPLVEAVRGGVVGVHTVHRPQPPGIPEAEVAVGGAPRDARPIGERGALAGVDDPAQVPNDTSHGSGLLLDEQGRVLTALHVVAEPLAIAVDLPGLGSLPARICGADPSTDLALLQLDCEPERLRGSVVVPPLGDSLELRQGDWIFALGDPLEFRQTLTVGVVGFVGRHLRHDGRGVSNDYLQFSAQSLPGSSGSPVFDLHGQVVGILTRATDGGPSFAITVRVVRRVIDGMARQGGRVRRAHIGVAMYPAVRGATIDTLPPGGAAVCIEQVLPGLAADRAGLAAGDLLVACDGEPIRDVGALHERITWSEPGTHIRLGVVRDGRWLGEIDVELGELGQGPDPGVE